MRRQARKLLRQCWVYFAACAALLGALGLTIAKAAEPAGIQAASAPGSVQSVSLQLGRCGGRCPVYRVEVYATGEVLYFADVKADAPSARQQISVEDWQRILDAFNESHFDRLQPEYTSKAHGCRALRTDASTLRIAVQQAAQTQQLVFYTGCDIPERATIMWLSGTIAELSGARDWWARYSQQGRRKQVE